MILGVSHIVLGSTSLTRDRLFFEALGWMTQFDQRNIATFPGKRPFMSTDSVEQGLVFLHPPRGTPVELIHYAASLPDQSPSPLQIVLPGCNQSLDLPPVADDVPWPGSYARWPADITCPLWFADDAPTPSLIVHQVTDLETAARFWENGLGFQPAPAPATDADGRMFEFRSPMTQWCARLLLVPRPGPEAPGLVDGPGYRCLSLVCSSLARDREIVLNAGAISSTGVMDLTIAGKPLRLELFHGPDGVMVELFQTSR